MYKQEHLTREIECAATLNEDYYVDKAFRAAIETCTLDSLDFVDGLCFENWYGDLKPGEDGERGDIYIHDEPESRQRCAITDEMTDCIHITYIVM